MHSSGTRTARLFTVSQHALHRGVSAPGPGVSAQGGVCLWSLGGGGSASGGSASGPWGEGMSGSGVPGGCVSQHAMGQTPPRGQTDTCENITFADFVCGR